MSKNIYSLFPILEQKFKSEIPVLQADETVELAYKHGRDMFIITTKRVMVIDVQGLSGKKVEFKSIPFKFINGFSVESAGTLSFSRKKKLKKKFFLEFFLTPTFFF